MRTLRFIGLGTTGDPIREDLLDFGVPITVWSRTESRMAEIASLGAVAGERARIDAPVPLPEAGG